jgi:hypothetical protein
MGRLFASGLTLAFLTANAMAAVDPDLLNLVMPEARMVVGARVDQSEASPFGHFVLGQMPSDNAQFQIFMAATGFDPRRDLREVLLAAEGGNPSAGRGLLLARGAFQPSLILATAKGVGAAVSTYHGIDVLTTPDSSGFSAAFLDASTVVAGNPGAVRAAIDRHIARIDYSGPLTEKAMNASANNQVWFATTVPLSGLLKGQLGNLSNMSPQNLLKAVSSVFGGATFGSDSVTISVTTGSESEKDAQGIAEVMKFLSNMMSQTGATVEQTGALVHMTMSISEQQAEQWFNSQQGKPKKIASLDH